MAKTLLALIVVVALAGGYYWYTQSAAPVVVDEMDEPFGSANTVPPPSSAGNTMPPGATMEDGTLPEDDASAPAPSAGINAGVNATATAGTAAVREITISNDGMAFNPKAVTVAKGTRVKMTFQNTGGTHDLRLEGYGVGTEVLSRGESESFEFVANEAGDFEYYCSVANHRALGMVGTLTVTE